MIGIYRIVSPSNKVYIGQTWNSVKRFSNYRKLYCTCQTKLYNSLKKYGPEKHVVEIIYELPQDATQEMMDKYEEFYINQYKACNVEMMNLREPGSRGRHSEESKKKMSRVWNRPEKSTEEKKKISESLKEYYKLNGTYNHKEIIQKNLDGSIVREWKSARVAALALNIKFKGISAVATSKNGRYKTYKGFIWTFK